MIIVLNGSFGVGKSSTAEALLARLPNAMIFDPEIVGQMVRFITLNVRKGHEDTDDFQDIAMWRTDSLPGPINCNLAADCTGRIFDHEQTVAASDRAKGTNSSVRSVPSTS